ncbi:MAG: hypothetical protein ACRCS3_13390 [Paracoccaceae bacterium]
MDVPITRDGQSLTYRCTAETIRKRGVFAARNADAAYQTRLNELAKEHAVLVVAAMDEPDSGEAAARIEAGFAGYNGRAEALRSEIDAAFGCLPPLSFD